MSEYQAVSMLRNGRYVPYDFSSAIESFLKVQQSYRVDSYAKSSCAFNLNVTDERSAHVTLVFDVCGQLLLNVSFGDVDARINVPNEEWNHEAITQWIDLSIQLLG